MAWFARSHLAIRATPPVPSRGGRCQRAASRDGSAGGAYLLVAARATRNPVAMANAHHAIMRPPPW